MTRDELAELRKSLGLKRPITKDEMAPSESQEQMALFRWAGNAKNTTPELAWLYSVPNGGLRSKASAGKIKGEGAKSGVFDIALDAARGGFFGLRIELKVPALPAIKGVRDKRPAGKLSPEQLCWHAHYIDEGYAAHIAYGWLQARDILVEYLARERTNIFPRPNRSGP